MCNSNRILLILSLIWSTHAAAQMETETDPHAHHHMAEESPAPTPKVNMDPHAGHDMSAPMGKSNDHGGMSSDGASEKKASGPVLPEPTAADLEAAFPDLGGMDLRRHMDTPLLSYLLFEQLEWQDSKEGQRGAWNMQAWLGYDLDRLWIRSEGERANGEFESAEAHLLYGRAIARWWDAVIGVRQEFEPGPSRTSLALGLQGLAPYWFETQVTAYIGEGGQTGMRLEAEYELLLTNRLILQPVVEINANSQRDLQRGLGAGFTNIETGLRLRYEIRREFAPYVGLNWSRSLGNTADLIEAAGGDSSDTSLVVGLRMWF